MTNCAIRELEGAVQRITISLNVTQNRGGFHFSSLCTKKGSGRLWRLFGPMLNFLWLVFVSWEGLSPFFIQAGFTGVTPVGPYSWFNVLLKILNKFWSPAFSFFTRSHKLCSWPCFSYIRMEKNDWLWSGSLATSEKLTSEARPDKTSRGLGGGSQAEDNSFTG